MYNFAQIRLRGLEVSAYCWNGWNDFVTLSLEYSHYIQDYIDCSVCW